MTRRDQIYQLYEIVKALAAGNADANALAGYTEREIADAWTATVNSAAQEEREACAQIAEGTPGGFVGRDSAEYMRGAQDTAREIARQIRQR